MKITKQRLIEIIKEEILSIREANEALITEGTRSTIAIEDKKGNITGTYVHSDGYVEGVGAILKKNYSKADKVESLLALGEFGISSLSFFATLM